MLVRHAEAVAPSDPRYEENDRPLTDAGRRDAERLAGELAAEAADAIYSSPYPRAVQTVEPFARRVGSEISLVDDLHEAGSPDGMAAVVREAERAGTLAPAVESTLYTWNSGG